MFLDFQSLSTQYIVLNIALALLISFGATLVLLVGLLPFAGFLSSIWRRLLVKIAFYAFKQAVSRQYSPIEATGIGPREGSVVIRLEAGSNSGVAYRAKFRVTNAATGETWGIIEAVEVDDTSCTCIVSDRSNPDFWDELEGRMRRDAAPPQGVTITREFPEDIVEIIRELLKSWRS